MILVGEMRDMETIGTALTAAETGHLVFATLHTQDAPQTIDRIIDVFPPAQQGQVRAQLAIGLQGVVTQTLRPDRRRQRPLRRGRGARAHPGRAQPDPRGQDAPDLLADPDRRASTACRRWTPRWPASSAQGTITMARRRDARVRARRAAQARPVRQLRRHARTELPRRWQRNGRRDLHLQGGRRLRHPVRRARSPAPARTPSSRSSRPAASRSWTSRRRRPASRWSSRSCRSGSRPAELTVMTRQLATMISSGMTLLRAFYVLEEQIENKLLRETHQRRPRGHRGRPLVLRRARQAPEGLQPALRRHGARRRGRRRARGVARARRRPAREGRLAAPPGQVRDGLPDRRADLRARPC